MISVMHQKKKKKGRKTPIRRQRIYDVLDDRQTGDDQVLVKFSWVIYFLPPYDITWPSESDEHASLTLVFALVCMTYLSRLNFLFTLNLQTVRCAGITFDWTSLTGQCFTQFQGTVFMVLPFQEKQQKQNSTDKRQEIIIMIVQCWFTPLFMMPATTEKNLFA